MVEARFRKDVTDTDIERICRNRISAFESAVQPCAVPTAHSEPKAEGRVGQETEPRTMIPLTEEECAFLESILEDPNLTITQRRDYLGLSTYKNDRIKKRLLKQGLVMEFALNLGFETRGIVKFLELTDKGYEKLGRNAPHKNPDNCSPQHWFWQQNIFAFYKSQGFETEIEMCLNGKRADVGFVKDGIKIAVEVGLTPKNEVVNVQKDLEAGFHRVLVACKNAKVKAAVEQRLRAVLKPEDLSRVKLILLSEFAFVKDIVGKTKLQ